MRTRIFNKMTANEVEAYLARGGNTIFVGVGVVEVHGAMPIDAETVIPEAFAVAMAERADGLAMINLPYFFPGGTIVSNATVQVTVRDSIDYLMMICRSLVAQGFRKIFLVSGHMPAGLYIDAMCRDFFQETKVHVCHLIPFEFERYIAPDRDMFDFSGRHELAGAYKILHQEAYLPIDPNAVEQTSRGTEVNIIQRNLTKALKPFGGKTSIYYASPDQHGGGRAYHSVEERDEACAKGEKQIRDLVEKMDLEALKNALDAYHEHVEQIMQMHPRLRGKY